MNVDTLQNPATETPRGGDVLFQQIVDSIPVPVAVTTPAGDVEGVNRQTLQYFGKSFDELRGWKASDAVHPEDLARTIAAQIAAHKSGDSYNVESRHRRADGVYRWFSVRGFPLRDEQGNILRWFHLLNDIDDRKRAEEAVRASQHDLNQIVNTIPALVWSARPDGSAEFFNPHYLRYVGMSAEEARDLGWAAAVHPGDLHGLIDSWKRLLTSEQAGEAEARLRRFDGVYRWFLFRANPLRNESGAIVKWYGINIDIHDRKQSEDRLQQSEARKAAMFEAALSCIVMIDQEGVITEFNPSAEITFGYRQENVVGKRIDEVIISPPCRLRYPPGFARHLAS